jgi:prepilin-type N-terminal cleavage/methylation domain-containing protein
MITRDFERSARKFQGRSRSSWLHLGHRSVISPYWLLGHPSDYWATGSRQKPFNAWQMKCWPIAWSRPKKRNSPRSILKSLLHMKVLSPTRDRTHQCAFTLVEVVVSLAIAGVVFGGIILGYVQSGKRAEWTGYSLAAQALSIRQIEQARAAKWDTQSSPPVDQVTNFNFIGWTNVGGVWSGYTYTILDIPYKNLTNAVMATNYVSISTVQVTNNVFVHMIQVDTVWPFYKKSATNMTLFTNTTVTYRAPNQ